MPPKVVKARIILFYFYYYSPIYSLCYASGGGEGRKGEQKALTSEALLQVLLGFIRLVFVV